MIEYFEVSHRSTRKQIAVERKTFHHFLSDFFRDDPLHRLRDKLQIALIRDLELDFVPYVGKERPRIIPNNLIEYFFVGKSDDAAAGMIARNILAAKFPKSGIQI